MTQYLSQDLIWWITVIEIPVVAGLFWLIWRNRDDSEKAVRHLQNVLDVRSDQLRDALFAFKLEVAKTYASQKDLRNVEMRIVEHLLRIESKLDRTALKAESLGSKTE